MGGQAMLSNIQNIITLNPSEIVKWCREQKQSLGYSNAKLAELSGVPIGTVDRIMAGKYNEYKYSSIQPIVACLLGYGEETPEPKTDNKESEYYYNTINGYKLVLESKNKEIEQLKAAYDALYTAKEFLKKENETKEEHLKFLESIISDLRKG